MAKLAFGLRQSLDGYLDHLEKWGHVAPRCCAELFRARFGEMGYPVADNDERLLTADSTHLRAVTIRAQVRVSLTPHGA
jgi:hypothetical protein